MALRGTRPPRAHAGGRTLVFGLLVGLVIGLTLALLRSSGNASGSGSSRFAELHWQREQPNGDGWRRNPTLPAGLPMEVYARGPSQDKEAIARVASLLSDDEKKQLRELCGRTLYHSLQTGWVSHETGAWTFVATGACGGLEGRFGTSQNAH